MIWKLIYQFAVCTASLNMNFARVKFDGVCQFDTHFCVGEWWIGSGVMVEFFCGCFYASRVD